jgi:fructose-bisphosphate aldolase class II
MKGEPKLDFERLAQINQALNLPLVIHGGTGLSDNQFSRLIENGVAKINYYTALADAAGQRIHASQQAGISGYTGLVQSVPEAVRQEAARCIDTWGSTGRAEALLAYCRPWLPVEHAIFYNTKDLDAAGVEEMMDEGRRVLGAIPGVLRVFTGHAVEDSDAYRHCWLVRFASRPVIDSYRKHPAHRQFADKRFRPYAGDRVSIDFEESSADSN